MAIQVIYKTKPIRKVLFSVEERFWDDKNGRVKTAHPLYMEYNELITDKLHDVERRCITAVKNNWEFTKELLFEAPAEGSKLIDVLNAYADSMTNKKKWVAAEKYRNIAKKVGLFAPETTLGQVHLSWLDKFRAFLMETNSHNTTSKNISMLLTALRDAARDVQLDQRIFTFKLSYKPTTKDKLSKEEFIRLRDLELIDGQLKLCRDIFLLSFYLRGRRIGDVLTLQHSDIQNGRVVRQARKTEKPMDIAIVEPAMEIIKAYSGKHPVYVMPLMKMHPPADPDNYRYRKQIESKTAIVNTQLKILAGMIDCEKNLTTHVARHTFAYLADQSGMTTKRIKDMLEHSDLNTTDGYVDDLRRNDVLDAAMLEFVRHLD